MTDFAQTILASIIGGAITLTAQYVMHLIQTGKTRKADDKRSAILASMLKNPGETGWRQLRTMAHVIGATEQETARLLIEMDCRASETGSGGWAYVKNKPLPEPTQNDQG